MPELSVRERLQPSLLDRLTDDEPNQQIEGRERRVISLERLRQCVLRDLSWLLNTGRLSQIQDLEEWPEVMKSVLNYGAPDLSGQTASGSDVGALEIQVRQAIWDFEPRLLRHSVKVRAILDENQMNPNALKFEIEGVLWAQPAPLRLLLQTEVDLDTGHTEVRELAGR